MLSYKCFKNLVITWNEFHICAEPLLWIMACSYINRKNYYSQWGTEVQEFLLIRWAISLKSWMMSEGIVGKGLGWVGSKETDALIFSSPWKCFAGKKGKERNETSITLTPCFYFLLLNLKFPLFTEKKPSQAYSHSSLTSVAPLTHTLTYIHFNQTPLLIIPIGFFHLPAICCLITKIISRGGAEGPLPWRPNGKGQGEFILSAIENGY